MLATEPDVLLFTDIPNALGHDPIGPDATGAWKQHEQLAADVATAMRELRSAQVGLHNSIRETLVRELHASDTDTYSNLASEVPRSKIE